MLLTSLLRFDPLLPNYTWLLLSVDSCLKWGWWKFPSQMVVVRIKWNKECKMHSIQKALTKCWLLVEVLGNIGGCPCNQKSCFHVIGKHCSLFTYSATAKTMFPSQISFIWPHHSKMHKLFLHFHSIECIIPILLLINHSQNDISKWNQSLTVPAFFYMVQMTGRKTHVTMDNVPTFSKYLVLIWNPCRWYHLILTPRF